MMKPINQCVSFLRDAKVSRRDRVRLRKVMVNKIEAIAYLRSIEEAGKQDAEAFLKRGANGEVLGIMRGMVAEYKRMIEIEMSDRALHPRRYLLARLICRHAYWRGCLERREVRTWFIAQKRAIAISPEALLV